MCLYVCICVYVCMYVCVRMNVLCIHIFLRMNRDLLQACAAQVLYRREWRYVFIFMNV
jgi:hypothetical protein